MIKKLLPLLMLVFGVGAGIAIGVTTRPPPDPEHVETGDGDQKETSIEAGQHSEDDASATKEYVKLSNQFVIPIVQNDQVSALVVVGLSVEVVTGNKEIIYAREPRLRDSFLQVMFDHANIGGFDGTFTNANNLDVLRVALREVARRDLGDIITDVLIVDVVRQDI